jgi:excisionase family DNA binding protein
MRKRKNLREEAHFITTGVAAKVLGVTASTVRAAVRRKELRAIRLGNRTLIEKASLQRLLQPDPTNIAGPTP